MGFFKYRGFEIWAFLNIGVFEIWAVFRYRVLFRYGLFWKKVNFASVRDLSIFGWEVVLGYFAKISILPFFPWHAKNRV
jgi:hypothetical protein